MPRRRRRFADLERQFRESGGVAKPGSRLDGYIKFKSGETSIKVEKKLSSEERKRYRVAIIPFGFSVGTTPQPADRYEVAMTAYSNTQRSDLGLTNTEMGYEKVTAATSQDGGFYPALVKVFVASGAAKTSPKSAITQKEYSRTPGASYSYPFGRVLSGTKDAKTDQTETTLAEVDEEDAKEKIRSLITNSPKKAQVKSISFVPEEFKPEKPTLEDLPGL